MDWLIKSRGARARQITGRRGLVVPGTTALFPGRQERVYVTVEADLSGCDLTQSLDVLLVLGLHEGLSTCAQLTGSTRSDHHDRESVLYGV